VHKSSAEPSRTDMLRAHEPLLLNWFKARGEVPSGAIEGLNNKIRVVSLIDMSRPQPVER
jgi:hypothetical protein